MITDIRLQHFRSYDDESFEFGNGVNIIVGPNASGKTNLLEAVLVNCLGKSYRVKDAELVRHDNPWARLDATSPEGVRSVKMIVGPGGDVQKTFVIQDVTYKRLSLQKTLPVVLFEPNHLLLLAGSPEVRRNYLDDLLEQIVPGYATLRRQYKRTLTQRNALLKQGVPAASQLFAWNIRLSQLGGQIVAARQRVIAEMAAALPGLYVALSHSDAVASLDYSSACDIAQYSSDMLYKLEQSVEKDMIRGFTSYGPHRDDFITKLHGHPSHEVASRGEVRTLLLALKVIELRLLETHRGQKPILLLDDVFSELDGARRRALTDVLQTHQTFITTTDADVVVQHFMGNCTIIPLGVD